MTRVSLRGELQLNDSTRFAATFGQYIGSEFLVRCFVETLCCNVLVARSWLTGRRRGGYGLRIAFAVAACICSRRRVGGSSWKPG